jgi:hypothetical protein
MYLLFLIETGYIILIIACSVLSEYFNVMITLLFGMVALFT